MVGLKESDFIFQSQWSYDSRTEWKKRPAREIMVTLDSDIGFLKMDDGKCED